jgi:hypothetical protein
VATDKVLPFSIHFEDKRLRGVGEHVAPTENEGTKKKKKKKKRKKKY